MSRCPKRDPKRAVPGSKLSDQFFVDLALLGRRHRTDPTVFLTPWCFESDLDPGAVNPHGGARGLNQMMPFNLKRLHAPAEFQRLSGEEQLPFIEKMIREGEAMNGGHPFATAARYYHSNAYPATMVRGTSPDTVVYASDAATEQERRDFAANSGLDLNGDKRVTIGDLEELMRCIRADASYKPAFARLEKAVRTLSPAGVSPSTPAPRVPAPNPLAPSVVYVARGDSPNAGRTRSTGGGGLLVGGICAAAIGFVATRSKR